MLWKVQGHFDTCYKNVYSWAEPLSLSHLPNSSQTSSCTSDMPSLLLSQGLCTCYLFWEHTSSRHSHRKYLVLIFSVYTRVKAGDVDCKETVWFQGIGEGKRCHCSISSFNPLGSPDRYLLSLSLPYRWGSWGQETLSNLPKFSPLARRKTRTWVQAVWIHCPLSFFFFFGFLNVNFNVIW